MSEGELTVLACSCGWQGLMTSLVWDNRTGYCPKCKEFVVEISDVAS